VAEFAQLLLMGKESELVASLETPLLVWNAPARDEDDLLLSTRAGGRVTRPEPGEAIAYELRKGNSVQNGFAFGITVGRTENNDVIVEDNSVSRFHAFFQHDARQGWRLVDAESSNGTWLGPLKLTPNKAESMRDGDRLRFGDVEMQFMLPATFVTWVKGR
jgi:pSer/pThr/pTyr-binding forkhead associated (FHA) protein